MKELEVKETVNHPDHYNKIGIECIEVARHFNFNRGNALKYIWRAGEKDKRKETEDLKKAIWYLADEIKKLNPTLEVKIEYIEYKEK